MCIILLDTLGEELLTVKPDPAEHSLIGSIRRVSARGWGNAMLLDCLNNLDYRGPEQKAMVEELQITSCAFSQIIASSLFKADKIDMEEFGPKNETPTPSANIPCDISRERLLQASKFLFDNQRLAQEDLKTYLAYYAKRSLDRNLPLPTTFETVSTACGLSDALTRSQWGLVTRLLRYFSVYIIAFAHIINPEECENLSLCGAASDELSKHKLVEQLESWNGLDKLYVRSDAWLQAITVPLVGQSQDTWTLPWGRVCLISDRGWSVWIPTFGVIDPVYIKGGSLFIGRGNPCRNGVWKGGVLDMRQGRWDMLLHRELAEIPGQQATLRCAQKASFLKPLVGEGEDFFLISARIKLYSNPTDWTVQKIGFREMQTSLWGAQVTTKCHHATHQDTVDLPIGCATLTGYGARGNKAEERILACLTANSIPARWLAVTSFAWTDLLKDGQRVSYSHRLLRSKDCCFRCAIGQAAIQSGKSYLIL